jgi:hypothetical protein
MVAGRRFLDKLHCTALIMQMEKCKLALMVGTRLNIRFSSCDRGWWQGM